MTTFFVVSFLLLLIYTMDRTWPTRKVKYSRVIVTNHTTDTPTNYD